jgi:hypothetical protein
MKRDERGFAMLLVFALAATVSIFLYMQVPRIAFESQRNQEALLIERGEQYKRAIELFVRKEGRYPATLEELENLNNRRYLRRRYPDPLTGKTEWRIIHIQNGVFTDSLVHKNQNKEGEQKNQNTFISEFSGIGQTNPAAGAANAALRRRESEGGADPGMPGVPSAIGAAPSAAPGMFAQNPATQPGQPASSAQPGQPQFPSGVPGMPDMPNAIPGESGQPGQVVQPGQPGQVIQPGQPYSVQPGQPYPVAPGQHPVAPGQPAPVQPGQQYPGQPGQAYPMQPGQPYPVQQSPVQPGQPMPARSGQAYPAPPGQGNTAPPGLPYPVQPGQPYPMAPVQAGQPFPSVNPVQQGNQAGSMPVPGMPGVNQPAGGAAYPPMAPQTGGSNAAADMIRRMLTQPRPGGAPAPSGMMGMNLNGIAGVASTVERTGIKLYNERDKYNEWEFLYDLSQDRKRAGAMMGQQGGAASQPAQPQTPFGSTPLPPIFGTTPTPPPFGGQPSPPPPINSPQPQIPGRTR